MTQESASDPKDVELEALIYRQIRHMGSHIHVQVKDGHVTLSGTAEDFEDKRDIYGVVKAIGGVGVVTNQIVAAPTTQDVFDNFRA